MKKEFIERVDKRRATFMSDLPLFPLNVVLFPGAALPLHIFEPRYREMINLCLERKSPFGIVLIDKGSQTGELAIPHRVGTTAQIRRVQRYADGRMDIHVVGVQRFRVKTLDYSQDYLQASVKQVPVLNGATRVASQLAMKVRPKLVEYSDLLARAHSAENHLDYVPHDAKALAFLIGSSLQASNETRQKLLELPGVPEMLQYEYRLLCHEVQLISHMLNTQENVIAMSGGSSGYLFPN